ncbi:helix-turn-helix transcriptional regulator [Pseudonocardia sp. MH-G8]|uniref:ArsR/SmtB family transcription factor n=1 Tax=Pseudonocardia sp. MH-G8 TaxID=1854588 RepID=UPI000B9FD94C|nr:metalloregulator ArsR/SmtB family transcription factor [Pseudonocardia sp. MH-G8]OZM81999.1 transcriptional regulator [Pseudonocardia sp. MH-G8]
MSDDAVFEALADPTRRRILELVASGERTAGELAAEFATSRPAVSRHLRVLRDAGLVAWRGDAQRRLYRLDAAPLADAGAWIERTRSNWATRLDAFEKHLDERWNEE